MTDLSDFGGGVDHDPGPEDETRLKLSKWLRDSGADVYWDRDHSYGWGCFDPGNKARPDLLACCDERNYAIEVKPGDDSSKLHDGLPQLVNYWEHVLNGDAVYKVNGKKTAIDAFLIATDHSPYGRLYTSNGESDVIRTNHSDGHKKAVEIGELPKVEFNATERIIRALWRFSKDRRPNAHLGIGALLSSRLDARDDGGVSSATPAALFKSHGGQQPSGWNKPRHQWWEYMPYWRKKE